MQMLLFQLTGFFPIYLMQPQQLLHVKSIHNKRLQMLNYHRPNAFVYSSVSF